MINIEKDDLVRIEVSEYGVINNIIYATENNFVGRKIYCLPNCYLHKDAAAKLKKAIDLARESGFIMKIYDAFRPVSAQRVLWKAFPEPGFVSNPDSDNPIITHCRGVAVDLTLVNISDGEELDMGTPVDHFTKESHPAFTGFDRRILINRMVLYGIMRVVGFNGLASEWWHYELPNYDNYPVVEGAEGLLGGIVGAA